MGRVFFDTRKNVHDVDGAYTMLASDSGKDTPTGVITVAAGSAILDGVQKDLGGDAANSTAGTAVSNLLIGTATKQGDMINLFCDGSTYYFECLSSTNDSITTS